MGMEAVTGAAMTYQGSSSTAEIKVESQPKIDASQTAAASEALAAETTAINTKQTGFNSEEGGERNANQKSDQSAQATDQKKNAQIKKAVEDINRKANNSEAIFGIHEKTNRLTIKIVDKDTKEVIKELPPEKTLDMIAKVWEMAGLMVDEKR